MKKTVNVRLDPFFYDKYLKSQITKMNLQLPFKIKSTVQFSRLIADGKLIKMKTPILITTKLYKRKK